MKIATVGYGDVRGRAKQYPYYQAKVYRDHVTRDGRRVWAHPETVAPARRSAAKAERDARQYAQAAGIAYEAGIRAWVPVQGGGAIDLP